MRRDADAEAVGRSPAHGRPRGDAHSPFSRCWKEGENSLAVILAMRASSWAFCAAVRAASALAREWEVLAGGGGRAGQGSGSKVEGQWPPDLTHACIHPATIPPPQQARVPASASGPGRTPARPEAGLGRMSVPEGRLSARAGTRSC